MALRIITLESIKANSRIDGSDEDNLITAMGEAAEQAILNLINRSYDDLITEYGSVPAPVTQVCLMYTDHLYHHRGIVDGQQMYNVPRTFDTMLAPYRRFTRY